MDFALKGAPKNHNFGAPWESAIFFLNHLVDKLRWRFIVSLPLGAVGFDVTRCPIGCDLGIEAPMLVMDSTLGFSSRLIRVCGTLPLKAWAPQAGELRAATSKCWEKRDNVQSLFDVQGQYL